MSNDTFLQVQVLEFQQLLKKSADDPILGPQLQERLNSVQQALDVARKVPGTLFPKETPTLPRTAVFLRGGGVQGSDGIRPSLAGDVLIQYEKMFTEQALHDERIAARAAGRQRRPRGMPNPVLLFTGTPRGSFGLEFVPEFHEDASLLDVHAQSLVNVANAISRVVESDATALDNIVAEIPTRVLQPLTQFLKTLAQYGAELRLAFPNRPSKSLSNQKVKEAVELLEREVEQTTMNVSGTFRGVTLDSGAFDLRTDAGDVITGTVADQLTEDDLERMEKLLNKPCKAELQRTTIRKVTGQGTPSYVLLDAKALR